MLGDLFVELVFGKRNQHKKRVKNITDNVRLKDRETFFFLAACLIFPVLPGVCNFLPEMSTLWYLACFQVGLKFISTIIVSAILEIFMIEVTVTDFSVSAKDCCPVATALVFGWIHAIAHWGKLK